jgi:hypothetical protein
MLSEIDGVPLPWSGLVCGSKERCILRCGDFVEIHKKGRQPNSMLGTFILQSLHPIHAHRELASWNLDQRSLSDNGGI